jgi:hypothetical protein
MNLAQAITKGLKEEKDTIFLPANFFLVEKMTVIEEEKVYYTGSECCYYNSTKYQTHPFYKYPSRVINFNNQFEYSEIS